MWRRPGNPPGAVCITQSKTTCCTDRVHCPQKHMADYCTCVCVFVRTCVRACLRAWVRACVCPRGSQCRQHPMPHRRWLFTRTHFIILLTIKRVYLQSEIGRPKRDKEGEAAGLHTLSEMQPKWFLSETSLFAFGGRCCIESIASIAWA